MQLNTWLFYTDYAVYMVGLKRLELLHLAAPEPKSGASTNFATAPVVRYINKWSIKSNCFCLTGAWLFTF